MSIHDSVPVYRGTRVFEENEHAVVWEDVFEPGVALGSRHDARDYIVVI